MTDFKFELPESSSIDVLTSSLKDLTQEMHVVYSKVANEVWSKLASIFPIGRLGVRYNGEGEKILLILDDESLIVVGEIVYDRTVETEIKIVGRYNMENIKKYQTYFLDKLLEDKDG